MSLHYLVLTLSKTRCQLTSDRLVTFLADLSEQFDIALGTVWIVVLSGKLDMSQLSITLSTEETLPVEGSISECYASLQQHLKQQPEEKEVNNCWINVGAVLIR